MNAGRPWLPCLPRRPTRLILLHDQARGPNRNDGAGYIRCQHDANGDAVGSVRATIPDVGGGDGRHHAHYYNRYAYSAAGEHRSERLPQVIADRTARIHLRRSFCDKLI